MSETEFKQGEKIEVKTYYLWEEAVFIAMYEDCYVVDLKGNIGIHQTARKIQQPKLVHWESIEEVPLDAWYMITEGSAKHRVTGVNETMNEIKITSDWYGFEQLFKRLSYSHDLKTWHPCGKEIK